MIIIYLHNIITMSRYRTTQLQLPSLSNYIDYLIGTTSNTEWSNLNDTLEVTEAQQRTLVKKEEKLHESIREEIENKYYQEKLNLLKKKQKLLAERREICKEKEQLIKEKQESIDMISYLMEISGVNITTLKPISQDEFTLKDMECQICFERPITKWIFNGCGHMGMLCYLFVKK